MRVTISDTKLMPELVRYLRAREYLAVEEGGAVTVVPIHVMTKHAGRGRVEREVQSWLSRRRRRVARVITALRGTTATPARLE